MSESEKLSLGQLENEVQSALEDLLHMDLPDWISPHRGTSELYSDDVQAYGIWEYAIPRLSKLKWFSRKYKNDSKTEALIKAEIEENAIKAKELIEDKSVLRDYICPALSKGTNDLFDIAKSLTPVLTTLEIVGTLPFSITPLVIALVALMITRIGIDKLCPARN